MIKELSLSEKEKRMFSTNNKNTKNFPYKVCVDPMVSSLKDECERENFVSFYQTYPLVEKSVPLEEAYYIIYANPYARIEDFTENVLSQLKEIGVFFLF